MDHGSTLIEAITFIIQAFEAFVLIFATCELGEMVNGQFNMFNVKLNQCDWYLLPVDIQRIFVLTLVNSQNPITFCAYGNIPCSRKSLKKVESSNFILDLQMSIIFCWFFSILDDSEKF